MYLSKGLSLLSFIGALAIGMAAAYVAAGSVEAAPADVVDVHVSYELRPMREVRAAEVRAADLVGVWTGTWGHQRDFCTIEIERVDGDRFYGTLRESGAEIAFAGELYADGRRVFFRETKVIRLGADMSEWSLGTNTATFSPDGRSLTGTGIDKWGTYGWNAAKD